MREIKFRAWDNKSKIMYPWEQHVMSWSIHDKTGYLSIMQYTGLKDKNGKEIYEGDIANIVYRDMRYSHWMEVTDRGVMTWIDKSAQFSFEVKNSILDEEMQDLKVEVIGNLHENPELLGGKKNE